MNLTSRMQHINELFSILECTSSRIEKEQYINDFKKDYPELLDDLVYCFEVLAGMHKINFKLCIPLKRTPDKIEDVSIRDKCKILFEMQDHSDYSIYQVQSELIRYGWFLNPLFNREWKLGIGPSLLDKKDITPMLAKKYDPDKISDDDEYYITEKLDGNRCVAKYSIENGKWEFFSRSGKVLKVDFDMKDLPKEYIYDGEILSVDQISNPSQENFNTLSGIINSKNGDKTRLIYTIFDLMINISYKERTLVIRDICAQKLKNNPSSNVIILPLLAICNKQELNKTVQRLLDEVTARGGEGVMINLGSWTYQHKRTDKLLKVKNVYTMDMQVTDIIPGTGKYDGLVGSLLCVACEKNGEAEYHCQVGSGLSDFEREQWSANPEKIIGKIVEVAYFSISQDKNNRGSLSYSLRFPRFKRIRNDKSDVSIY